MNQNPQQNKFTAEIIVFSVVALVVLNSAYQLLSRPVIDRSPSSLSTTAESSPKSTRPIDSQALFEQYRVKCDHSEFLTTKASKIRLTGTFCGRPAVHAEQGMRLINSQIENITTQYNATVFLDATTGEFSSDFIQLESGKNTIKILFVYENKRSVPVELTVVRQELISAN